MSRIICKKHGRQAAVEICCHLSDMIRKPKKLLSHEDFKLIKISYEDLDPDLNELEDCSTHYFCERCVKKYRLLVNKSILSGDRDSTYHQAFNEMVLICFKCLEESMN